MGNPRLEHGRGWYWRGLISGGRPRGALNRRSTARPGPRAPAPGGISGGPPSRAPQMGACPQSCPMGTSDWTKANSHPKTPSGRRGTAGRARQNAPYPVPGALRTEALTLGARGTHPITLTLGGNSKPAEPETPARVPPSPRSRGPKLGRLVPPWPPKPVTMNTLGGPPSGGLPIMLEGGYQWTPPTLPLHGGHPWSPPHGQNAQGARFAPVSPVPFGALTGPPNGGLGVPVTAWVCTTSPK